MAEEEIVRVLLPTIGSRGDVEPYLAFAKALQATGRYRVAFLTHDIFSPTLRAAGFDFFPLQGDPSVVLTSEEFKHAFYKGNIMDQKRAFENALKHVEKNGDLTFQAAQEFKPHFILGTVVTLPECISVGQQLQIPVYFASPFPCYPSKHLAIPLIFPTPFRFEFMNSMINSVVVRLTWGQMKERVNAYRRRAGMPELPMLSYDIAPMLNIFSPSVQPPPADWPITVHTVGYWGEPVVTEYEADEALSAFLAAGSPPVYIGFGSMPIFDTVQFVKDCVTAVTKLGRRAIICAGWSGMDQIEIPDTVLFIKGAPHTWLFPKCCAAVHHGGAGTTFASMRSAIPTVIFPVMGDQTYWAHRMGALGVGPTQVVSVKEFNADTLFQQLSAVLTPETEFRAKQLADQLRQEDGIDAGIKLIDKLWQHDREYARTMSGAPVQWKKFEDCATCAKCQKGFGFFTRRHHCNTCGDVFCASCVVSRPLMNWNGLVEVCAVCDEKVKKCWSPYT